jgi:hypothetical protein
MEGRREGGREEGESIMSLSNLGFRVWIKEHYDMIRFRV